MGTVHRDHSNLVNIEKRLKRGRVEAREHSNSPRKNRDLYARKYISNRMQRKGGLVLCFGIFGAFGCGKTELPTASTKEMWAFFRGFFAACRCWEAPSERDRNGSFMPRLRRARVENEVGAGPR